MIIQPTYRNALKEALMRRIAVNPKYSLRAFARDLGLSPSYLSQVLSGSRGLTVKKSATVFARINVAPDDSKIYELEIKKEHLRTDKNKDRVQAQIDSSMHSSKAFRVEDQRFNQMSDWHAMVLLQLFFLKQAPLNSKTAFVKFAARKLSISEATVKNTIQFFLDSKLIASNKAGYKPLHSTVWTNTGVPSAAIRAFHTQMIEKAKQSVELQVVDERTLHALQLPVASEDFEQISKEILKFRDHLLRKYSRADVTKNNSADTVYGINFQLFRLINKD